MSYFRISADRVASHAADSNETKNNDGAGRDDHCEGGFSSNFSLHCNCRLALALIALMLLEIIVDH